MVPGRWWMTRKLRQRWVDGRAGEEASRMMFQVYSVFEDRHGSIVLSHEKRLQNLVSLQPRQRKMNNSASHLEKGFRELPSRTTCLFDVVLAI
jgi:hypothetical protein